MYTLYREWLDPDRYPIKCDNLRQYRVITNNNNNLGFHKPKKDLYTIRIMYIILHHATSQLITFHKIITCFMRIFDLNNMHSNITNVTLIYIQENRQT